MIPLVLLLTDLGGSYLSTYLGWRFVVHLYENVIPTREYPCFAAQTVEQIQPNANIVAEVCMSRHVLLH